MGGWMQNIREEEGPFIDKKDLETLNPKNNGLRPNRTDRSHGDPARPDRIHGNPAY